MSQKSNPNLNQNMDLTAETVEMTVALTAALEKAAQDYNQRRQEKQAAEVKIAAVVALLADQGKIEAHEREKCAQLLEDHAQTLELFKYALQHVSPVMTTPGKVVDSNGRVPMAKNAFVTGGKRPDSNELAAIEANKVLDL